MSVRHMAAGISQNGALSLSSYKQEASVTHQLGLSTHLASSSDSNISMIATGTLTRYRQGVVVVSSREHWENVQKNTRQR